MPALSPAAFNLRTFDLNLLKVFNEVMAERSLTRAARQLALTQPAVSNALRRLRDALDDELLVRKGHTLEPTPRALELWPAVRQALGSLHYSLSPQHFDAASSDHSFLLTMADATAADLLPALVQRMGAEAPGVMLRVVPLTTRDPRRLLDEGQADLAVGNFPAVHADLTARAQTGDSVAYRSHRLFSGDYVCVMRRNHPCAQAPLTLDAYCAQRHLLVSFSGKPFGFVDEALALLGRARHIVLTVNQFFTAGRVVAQSDLLTVLPRHFLNVTGMAQELTVRELPFSAAPIRIDMLWHQRRDADPAHLWLRQQMEHVASGHSLS